MKDNKFEDQELVEDTVIEEYSGEEDEKVHGLIYNVVGLLGCTFFLFFFGGGGILAITQKDSDFVVKIIGCLFVIYAIFIGYKDFLFGKSLIENISAFRREKKVVITLGTIGYFIYNLLFITIMIVFIIMMTHPNSNFINENYGHIFILIAIEGIGGTLLITIDGVMSYFQKNTKIMEIDKENDNK